MLPTKERLFQRKFLPYYALQQCFELHVSLSIMLICNQLRLNFEFWRSSFARMPVGVASKIKRLSSAQVWRSSVSELLVVTASAPIEKIDVDMAGWGSTKAKISPLLRPPAQV